MCCKEVSVFSERRRGPTTVSEPARGCFNPIVERSDPFYTSTKTTAEVSYAKPRC